MSKNKIAFCCQTCGSLYPKWTGQCTECNEWNTIIEEITTAPAASSSRFQGYSGTPPTITAMAEVELQE